MSSLRFRAALGAALLMAALAPPSEADIVICKNKNRIKLREDSCRGKEVLLPATELGGTLPVGPAGGALTGTYPDPNLANGAVTTSKLEDAAVTSSKLQDASVSASKLQGDAVDSAKTQDGALRLVDLAVWEEAGNIGGTTVNANSCNYFNFNPPTGAQLGDLVLVRTDAIEPSGIILDANLFGAAPPHGLTGGVCNNSTGNITLPNPFLLRIVGIR